jgi:hypothetical protein
MRARVLIDDDHEFDVAAKSVFMLGLDRDMALAEASGRWPDFQLVGATKVDKPAADLTMTLPAEGGRHLYSPERYLPGDVVAIRARMAFVPMPRYLDVAEGKAAPEDHFLGGDQWSLSVARLVLEAVAYFLPAATAQGIMASVPPAAGLLSGLRLPTPVSWSSSTGTWRSRRS